MVRATCCICLEHKDFLRPWNVNPKCCNALVCLECAKNWQRLSNTCPQCRRPPKSLDWQDKVNIFMAVMCLVIPLIVLGYIAMFHECPKHVIDPRFKCVPGPPGFQEHSRGPVGPPGPPGMCGGPVGPVGPPGE